MTPIGNGISTKPGASKQTDMTRRRQIFLSLWLTLTFILMSGHAAAEEARIIQLKHRPAAEITPLLRPLLKPGDALTGTDYRLIIRASDKEIKEVEQLLVQLDVAARSLRITVAQGAASERGGTSYSVEGEAPIGHNARIILPKKSTDDRGLVIKKDDLRLQTQSRTTTRQNENTQTIMTLDGQRAYIRIGQSVPHVRNILTRSHHQTLITQGVEFQDVTTGFDVLPRVHGDRVRLEITPRLSTLRDPATGLADVQELTTTVETRLGEWIDLGAILGQQNEMGRAVLDSATTESGERRTIRLKVE